MSCYDLGNIMGNVEQWQQAIDLYKQALRLNPDDDEARYNLRYAQLKLQEQQNNQNQNQDQNKDQDKNKDQNKDQNKDKDKDQNKDQNKDKDKNKDQNQDQNQNKQQNQPQDQQNMSQQNADQALGAVQQKENDTQRKVKAIKARANEQERARTRNKW